MAENVELKISMGARVETLRRALEKVVNQIEKYCAGESGMIADSVFQDVHEIAYDALAETSREGASAPISEELLRKAWEMGFWLAIDYGDNYGHFQGEQKERMWEDALTELFMPPADSTCAGCAEKETLLKDIRRCLGGSTEVSILRRINNALAKKKCHLHKSFVSVCADCGAEPCQSSKTINGRYTQCQRTRGHDGPHESWAGPWTYENDAPGEEG